LLRSVTECDRDGKCKVPLPFEYSLGSYDFKEIPVDASEPAPVSVVDVNGDGRSDLILGANGRRELRIARSQSDADYLGDGFYPPHDSGLPSVGASQTLDVDADGRPEVLAEVSDTDPHRGPGSRYQLYRPTAGGYMAVPGKLGEWHPFGEGSRQPVYLADL